MWPSNGAVLTETERLLVAETEREALSALDEDQLLALHDWVRRARNKHVQLHRREAGRQVASSARGMASTPPRRSAPKAESLKTRAQ
jgi:hypothetical protein